MFWRSRSYWLGAGAVAYIAFAALRAESTPSFFPSPPSTMVGPVLPWVALGVLPAVLAIAWQLTAPPSQGEDRIEGSARTAARACVAGMAMVLAALSGPWRPGLTALGNLGAAISSMAALIALARISSLGGLMAPPAWSRRLEPASFASLLWTVAVALPAARALGPRRAAELDPILLDYATVAASLGALGLSMATAYQVWRGRRLELGVAERAAAALWLATTALLVGVLGTVVGVSAPERTLPLTAAIASAAIASSVVTREPTVLSRAMRLTLTLAALAAPIALLAVMITQAAPSRAGAAVFGACTASALAGLAARPLVRRCSPRRSHRLDAIQAALAAAASPDPEGAIEAALVALAAVGGTSGARPALFWLNPPNVMMVDRAGYRHVKPALLPEHLVAVAEQEPERTLRVEVARALEVRQPDLRPLVAWLDQGGLSAVVVVRDELAAVGLVGVPRGEHEMPMTLEEVRELRKLADRLGAGLGVSASLARSRAREVEARAEVERLSTEARRLVTAQDRDAGRLLAMARMLERPARAAAYSPAARATMEQLERLGQAGRPITLLTAPGIDTVAWAALAHLASPRRTGPLMWIEGGSTEYNVARFRDPEASPLVAAAGGTLVLLDVHALSSEVQGYVAAALPDEEGLIVGVPATVDVLVATGQINERLADKLGDRAVALPPLASRAEDLRALTLEHLARIGVQLGRKPLGLSPKALALLLEHPWPGNDTELHATLLKAALVTEGAVLGVKELVQAGVGTSS